MFFLSFFDLQKAFGIHISDIIGRLDYEDIFNFTPRMPSDLRKRRIQCIANNTAISLETEGGVQLHTFHKNCLKKLNNARRVACFYDPFGGLLESVVGLVGASFATYYLEPASLGGGLALLYTAKDGMSVVAGLSKSVYDVIFFPCGVPDQLENKIMQQNFWMPDAVFQSVTPLLKRVRWDEFDRTKLIQQITAYTNLTVYEPPNPLPVEAEEIKTSQNDMLNRFFRDYDNLSERSLNLLK